MEYEREEREEKITEPNNIKKGERRNRRIDEWNLIISTGEKSSKVADKQKKRE